MIDYVGGTEGGGGGGHMYILVCMQFKTKHIPFGGNKNMKTVF